MKPVSILGLLTAALLLAATAHAADPAVMARAAIDAAPDYADAPDRRHALWVVRDAMTSERSIRKLVDDAERAGITDLILQVRGRGDAYYDSELVPLALPLESARDRHGWFDPLDLALDLAHDRGIRVHAWINVYLVSSWSKLPRRHVTHVHPEWIAVDPAGTAMTEMSKRRIQKELTEGAYLDPGNPDVAAHLTAVCRELVERYPIDGLHLDYVRYPHMDVGYSSAMRQGFRERAGVDPLALSGDRTALERRYGSRRVDALREDWQRYKAERITALVREVRRMTRMTRPGVMLTAAVKPDPEGAVERYGQDWVRWVNEDLVDVVAPMMYSPSMQVMRKHVRLTADAVPPERVWAGIAVYNQSLSAAARKIDEAHEAGFGGVSIFSYNSVPGGGKALTRLNRAR